MYETKDDSGSKKIMIIVAVVIAVIILGAFAMIIIKNLNGNPAEDEACANKEGMSALERAGVFGEDGHRCNSDDDDEDEEEQEQTETKKRSSLKKK